MVLAMARALGLGVAAPARAQDATAATAIGALAEPVTPTTLIENAETRLVKVVMLANSTRVMHAHPDMVFHLFVTTDWPIILTVQGEARPILMGRWQAHYFKGGTVHAISNPNATPAYFLEFFTKKAGAAAANGSEDAAQALALAAALRGVADRP